MTLRMNSSELAKLVLTAFLILTLQACADASLPQQAQDDAIDELALSGPAPEAKSDEATIALTLVRDLTPSTRALASAQRRLITTPAAFRAVFGHNPPASLDLSRQWLVFYAAGRQPSGGHEASVEQVRLSPSGKSLVVITRHSAPADACRTAQESSPWTLVALPAQAVRPSSVRYYSDDVTLPCGSTPATCDEPALFGQLSALSQDLWMMSEGDEPVTPESWGQPGVSLSDDQALLELLQEPDVEGVFNDTGDETAASQARARQEPITLARFTQNLYRWRDEQVVELDEADKAALIAQIKATLGADARAFKVYTVYRDGGLERDRAVVRVYVVGATPCGLMGLRSVAIET